MECSFCNHEDSDHCKGNVAHTNYKEDARMLAVADRRNTVICVSRHCKIALCCCVAYLGPRPEMYDIPETPAERDAYLDALAREQ